VLQRAGKALLGRVEDPHDPWPARPLVMPLVHERADGSEAEPNLHEHGERPAQQRAALV